MAKNFFKKYTPHPDKIRQINQLKWLGTLLHDPNIWHMNRRSVSGAFAVGLFMMYVPLPFQMVPAAIAAILLRVNLPISVALVWITNPFTVAPITYIAYRVGSFLLGEPMQTPNFELSFDWIFIELKQSWQPFLLGTFVLSLGSSALGFISVRLLWRIHLVQRIRKKRQKHRARLLAPRPPE